LRQAGLGEIARRGLDPRLLNWLRGEGKGEFPERAVCRTPRPGWGFYFWGGNYNQW
jgi:hypothetical protein